MDAISLYSGAGGMDLGFRQAGFRITHACELNSTAAATLSANHPEIQVAQIPVSDFIPHLRLGQSSLVFGGPPCQGYSVAGKMDPNDPRSSEVWNFLAAVEKVRPSCFVMENVDALAVLKKWSGTLSDIRKKALDIGYNTHVEVLNASEFGVPQSRKRMFLFGSSEISADSLSLLCDQHFKARRSPSEKKTVRDVILHLGPAGTQKNPRTCTAAIRFASNPILRRSPYAGMLFNGAGRPLNPDMPSTTLAASAGGNKTHFVDEAEIFDGKPSYVEEYHRHLMSGGKPNSGSAPSFLRRLTLKETMALHSFPEDYIFKGSNSAQYRQIGNAVPCGLAQVVAECAVKIIQASSVEAYSKAA